GPRARGVVDLTGRRRAKLERDVHSLLSVAPRTELKVVLGRSLRRDRRVYPVPAQLVEDVSVEDPPARRANVDFPPVVLVRETNRRLELDDMRLVGLAHRDDRLAVLDGDDPLEHLDENFVIFCLAFNNVRAAPPL